MNLILYLLIHNFVVFDILDKNKECSKKEEEENYHPSFPC